MPLKVEICTLCEDPTGRAGRGEDSLYAASGTPAEIGPLCECCYNTITNAPVVEALRGFAKYFLDDLESPAKLFHISYVKQVAYEFGLLNEESGKPTSILTGDE